MNRDFAKLKRRDLLRLEMNKKLPGSFILPGSKLLPDKIVLMQASAAHGGSSRDVRHVPKN